jgi:hypothetical protein
MYTEEKIILTFIYKRSGKDHLTSSEIHLPLAIELKWFNNNDAKYFVQHCLELKILKKTTEGLQPTFDINTTKIPSGFTPSLTFNLKNNIPNNSTTMNKSNNIMKIITEHEKISYSLLMTRLKKLVLTKNITTIAAAVLYAKENEISLRYDLTDIEQVIVKAKSE